jgi:hypothetical protein
MSSPGTKRLRSLENTRVHRFRTAGQRLVQTLKHADEAAREIVKTTVADDLTDLAAALRESTKPDELQKDE